MYFCSWLKFFKWDNNSIGKLIVSRVLFYNLSCVFNYINSKSIQKSYQKRWVTIFVLLKELQLPQTRWRLHIYKMIVLVCKNIMNRTYIIVYEPILIVWGGVNMRSMQGCPLFIIIYPITILHFNFYFRKYIIICYLCTFLVFKNNHTS